MSTSPYLKLVTGNRLTNYMGFKLDNNQLPKYISNYMSVEVPVRELYLPSEEKVLDKGMRNQYIKVVPACTLDVKGNYMVEVEANSKLAEYGTISGGNYKIHPGDGIVSPSFYIQLRKDLELTDINYAIRLYLIP